MAHMNPSPTPSTDASWNVKDIVRDVVNGNADNQVATWVRWGLIALALLILWGIVSSFLRKRRRAAQERRERDAARRDVDRRDDRY
jgi:cytochrome c-type biogenesis protein CcmH/NrfF